MKAKQTAVSCITFAAFFAVLIISCGFENSSLDSGQETDCGAYVRVCVPFENASRTAVPSSSGTSFPVHSYVITASKSGQTDVSATLTDLTAKQKLSLESEGSWTVTVNGYASDTGTGEAICTGSGTISVSAAPYYDGYASVTVYPSGTGTGTISLAVSVPATVKGAKVTLTGPGTDTTAYAAVYTTAADGGMTIGTDANTFTISSLTATGATEAKAAFTAGAYTMTVQLYNSSTVTDSSTLIYRRTEVVAVWQGFATDRWINAYALESENSSAAAYSNTLTVTEDDLADTDATYDTLTVSSDSTQLISPAQNSFGMYQRCTCSESNTAVVLAVTVDPAQSVIVKKADGTAITPAGISENTSTKKWTLTYSLPAASDNDSVTMTVTAANGLASKAYVIAYGPEYVSSSGSDDTGTGTREAPYATIAKAVSMLPSSSDTNNKIILQSDITTNTTGTTNGYAADSSLVSFNYATAAKPLVLTIDGSGHAIKAGGTSASNRRVMYVGSNVTLTLQNVTLTGGYATNGGGVYLNGGTLNLLSGAKIGYTAGTEAAASSSCSNYASVNGGGIYMAADTGAVVNMYDGAYISYNYGGSNGAGVYLDGTSAANQNTFKMYGGKISCNTAANECGGLFLLYTTGSFMKGGSIEYNKTAAANGGGGGMNLHNGTTFTMSGGSIKNNIAQTKGGGVFVRWDNNAGHENYFIMTGGVISGNTAAKGSGVANDYSFTIGGSAVVAADNDVYLDKLASSSYVPCVTVADGYSIPSGYSYGAVITWYNGNTDIGKQVLAPKSGTLSYAQCNMFALTPVTGETGTISTLYCIAPSSGKGVTAKAGAGVTPTYTAPASYALSISADTVVPGGTISLKIKKSGSDVTNPTSASIALYQSGSPTGVSASSTGSLPSLAMPSWIVAGSYTVYMTAVIDGNSYSGFVSLTVKSEYTKTVNEDGTTTYKVDVDATKETVVALLSNTDSNAKEIVDLSSMTIENFNGFCNDFSYWCKDRVFEITLPTTLTTYDGQMFQSATNLRSISISSDNTSFSTQDGVLYNKDKTAILRYPPAKSGDSFTLPDTVTEAGYGAFENTNLTKIPNFGNITTIKDMQCFHNSKIQTLTLNSSLTSIPAYTFNGSMISKLTVPASVTSIGTDAFRKCESMTEIHFKSTTPPVFSTGNSNAVFAGHNSSLVIYVPSSALAAYKAATNWSAVEKLMEGEGE